MNQNSVRLHPSIATTMSRVEFTLAPNPLILLRLPEWTYSVKSTFDETPDLARTLLGRGSKGISSTISVGWGVGPNLASPWTLMSHRVGYPNVINELSYRANLSVSMGTHMHKSCPILLCDIMGLAHTPDRPLNCIDEWGFMTIHYHTLHYRYACILVTPVAKTRKLALILENI